MDPDELPGADDGPRSSSARLGAWFEASPVELIGLAVLLVGAIAVTVMVLWDTGRRPSELPPTASIGSGVDHAGRGDAGASTSGADPHAPGRHDATGNGDGEVEDAGEVVVHVSGAVNRRGVVTLPVGARVGDAITAAGGATTDADLDRLNLARLLADGEQVHVPAEGEEVPPTDDPVGAGVGADGRVDLNRASQEELETLPGIGPAKAAAIIEHRTSVGPFEVPGDLRAVPGIGERTFQQLADLVTVG